MPKADWYMHCYMLYALSLGIYDGSSLVGFLLSNSPNKQVQKMETKFNSQKRPSTNRFWMLENILFINNLCFGLFLHHLSKFGHTGGKCFLVGSIWVSTVDS